jgi:thioredoxin 1
MVDKRVVVKFENQACGSCKALEPLISRLCKELGISLVHVDVDKEPKKVQQYNVRGLPTLILIEEGTVIKSISGNISEKRLREWL